MQKMTNKRGFTLIELLVVIAIIGILSSVLLAYLNTSRGKARDTQRITEINQLQNALELFYSNCGSYPVKTGELLNTDVVVDCPSGITLGSFIKVPKPPRGTDKDIYGYSSDGIDYCLGADLETDDHIYKLSSCVLSGYDHTVSP